MSHTHIKASLRRPFDSPGLEHPQAHSCHFPLISRHLFTKTEAHVGMPPPPYSPAGATASWAPTSLPWALTMETDNPCSLAATGICALTHLLLHLCGFACVDPKWLWRVDRYARCQCSPVVHICLWLLSDPQLPHIYLIQRAPAPIHS